MQLDGGCRRQLRQLGADGSPLVLQGQGAGVEELHGHFAAGIEIEQAVDLAGELGVLAREAGTVAVGLGRIAHAFVAIGLHVGGDQLGVIEAALQAVDDGTFDVFKPIGPAVVAGAAFDRARALDAGDAVAALFDRHAAAAVAAAQQPGEDALGRADEAAAGGGVAATARQSLCGIERVAADDGELRRFLALLFAGVVDAADAPAGVGVAQHANLVPHDRAGIELVAQDAGAATGRADDGRAVPQLAAWREDAFGVQPRGDRFGADAAQIVGENPADDGGLIGDDLEHARPSRQRAVAIGASAGVATVTDDAGHAAPDLVLQILDEDRADEPAQADLQRVGGAIVHRLDADAGKAHALVDAGKVFLVAAQPVERFDDDGAEPAGLGIVQKAE